MLNSFFSLGVGVYYFIKGNRFLHWSNINSTGSSGAGAGSSAGGDSVSSIISPENNTLKSKEEEEEEPYLPYFDLNCQHFNIDPFLFYSSSSSSSSSSSASPPPAAAAAAAAASSSKPSITAEPCFDFAFDGSSSLCFKGFLPSKAYHHIPLKYFPCRNDNHHDTLFPSNHTSTPPSASWTDISQFQSFKFTGTSSISYGIKKASSGDQNMIRYQNVGADVVKVTLVVAMSSPEISDVGIKLVFHDGDDEMDSRRRQAWSEFDMRSAEVDNTNGNGNSNSTNSTNSTNSNSHNDSGNSSSSSSSVNLITTESLFKLSYSHMRSKKSSSSSSSSSSIILRGTKSSSESPDDINKASASNKGNMKFVKNKYYIFRPDEIEYATSSFFIPDVNKIKSYVSSSYQSLKDKKKEKREEKDCPGESDTHNNNNNNNNNSSNTSSGDIILTLRRLIDERSEIVCSPAVWETRTYFLPKKHFLGDFLFYFFISGFFFLSFFLS